MNSATKPPRLLGLLALFAAVSAFGLLASGCGDYGPTNVYSNSLFGQTQAGGSIHFSVQEFSLSGTAGVGPDQYVLRAKNVGSGGIVGPITAVVTASGDGSLESYAGTATATQTVTFGYAGQVIYSGDSLLGNATTPAMSGPYQYSFQVDFPNADSNTAETFTYTATDPKGDTWTGTLSGTND